ncbi:MAG: heme peroxidase family protein [Sphingomonas sp.]
MIVSLGHGERISWAAGTPAIGIAADDDDPDTVPAARAIPGADGAARAVSIAAAPESREAFGYLFPDAATLPPIDKAAALDALAAAMAETEGDSAAGDSDLPPVLTYFGQFIDHDITANTNSDAVTAALRIGVPAIVPQNRSLVVTGLKNMRKGTLGLDSLYGDGPIAGPMTDRIMAALREGIKMRVGVAAKVRSGTRPTLPPPFPGLDADGALRADLPRVGSLVGPGKPFASTAELPEALRPNGSSDNWSRRAFIGDSRNDENLIVAQLHTAFLRFHNAVVDWLGAAATFAKARQLVTWHYQWLIVNAYLPAICDGPTLANVIANEAPVYKRFLSDRASSLDPGSLPLPLEFSAAAFRFGHSMVRAEYDYNANFNAEPDPSGADFSGSFARMFSFTGNGAKPIGGEEGGGSPTLPDNWIIDWARFTHPTTAMRRARRIDTALTPPLFAMINESAAANGLFQRLAARNLRRAHVLALPSAQALIEQMAAAGVAPSHALTAAELRSGRTGQAIAAGGFDTATPLWFYVLKEAELIGGGNHLGPLGSRIVAETLFGLILNDKASYWNRPGGRFHPDQGAKPRGETVDSMTALFRAAGVA